MKRREFLEHGAAGALFLAGCRHAAPPSREAVLTALVHEIVVHDVEAVVKTSNELASAVATLGSTPSLETLSGARTALVQNLLAWKQAQSFRNGPMVETNAFVRTLFWPQRAAAIDVVLGGTGTLDDAFVAALGVDARGVYALEYLLYPLASDDSATLALFRGDAAQRRNDLCRALAVSIARYATDTGKALGDGTAYAARFAKGVQISLSILVNQMISNIESLSAHRIQAVLDRDQRGTLLAKDVEGSPSGTSHRIALAVLEGNARVFRGGKSGGLFELTHATAPAIADRVTERYAAAVAAVRALSGPLERIVKTNRKELTDAATAVKALELALKVDLASALGVTITFQTGDGD